MNGATRKGWGVLPRVVVLNLTLLMMLTTGCVGIYSNTENFLNPPGEGTDELDVLKAYGPPDFVTDVAGGKVFAYKVRDVKYIILVGIYEGYDLMVVVKDGKVEETRKVTRPKSFALLNPLPWAVTD